MGQRVCKGPDRDNTFRKAIGLVQPPEGKGLYLCIQIQEGWVYNIHQNRDDVADDGDRRGVSFITKYIY
jgi:hypothetical protein